MAEDIIECSDSEPFMFSVPESAFSYAISKNN
jgi:hypothetical protein